MPLTIPPFNQYQGTLFPLRGLWNVRPSEGDRFINAEIDWGSVPVSAIQFSMSGNSPVALTQIVALYVDNRRCGVDCDFLFPDSGFLLTVPKHVQGLFPVLTNALMYYVIAVGADTPDVTVVQTLNSLPPPIPLVPSQAQNSASIVGISTASGTTQIVPVTISGTLNAMSLSIDAASPAGGSLQITIIDGNGQGIWANAYAIAIAAENILVNLSGLDLRFRDGLSITVVEAGGVTGSITANLYYQTP